MRRLSEINQDLKDILGRQLTIEEQDHIYISQITGSWGFTDPTELLKEVHDHTGIDTIHHPDSWKRCHREGRGKGDLRYVAKVGNPIDWQCIHESYANSYIGIILCPEKKDKDGKICAAQFVGRQKYRIWMRIDQAEEVLKHLVRGNSLLTAVEKSLDIPLTTLEKELIAKVMRN